MATNHMDILKNPLAVNDTVVFCRAGSSKRMTVGTVTRVLPKTVEIRFCRPNRADWEFALRSPEDVVRV